MKSFAKICLILLTAVTMAAFTTNAQTDSTTPSTNAPAPAAKPKPKRYAGTIASVDVDGKTITITTAGGESVTLHIGSRTKIKKDGEPATLADAAAGQKVRGTEHKDDSDNWVANTVNIGAAKPKADAPPPAAPPAPADKQ